MTALEMTEKSSSNLGCNTILLLLFTIVKVLALKSKAIKHVEVTGFCHD